MQQSTHDAKQHEPWNKGKLTKVTRSDLKSRFALDIAPQQQRCTY
jgi:hypothetical protein